MKPIFFLVFAFLATPSLVQAQGANFPPYPDQDTETAWNGYANALLSALDAQAGVVNFNPFDDLAAAKRWKAMVLLTKALVQRSEDPEERYGFHGILVNPVNIALREGQGDTVKALIDVDRHLASLHDHGLQSDGLEPIALAVKLNDKTWVQYFLDHGAPINTGFVVPTKGSSLGNCNLLTISPTPDMDAFLMAKKIETLWRPDPAIKIVGTVNDQNVRLRSDASSKSQIITVLNKGDSLTITGLTYKTETIADVTSFWAEVQFHGQRGWVFFHYIDSDYFNMP